MAVSLAAEGVGTITDYHANASGTTHRVRGVRFPVDAPDVQPGQALFLTVHAWFRPNWQTSTGFGFNLNNRNDQTWLDDAGREVIGINTDIPVSDPNFEVALWQTNFNASQGWSIVGGGAFSSNGQPLWARIVNSGESPIAVPRFQLMTNGDFLGDVAWRWWIIDEWVDHEAGWGGMASSFLVTSNPAAPDQWKALSARLTGGPAATEAGLLPEGKNHRDDMLGIATLGGIRAHGATDAEALAEVTWQVPGVDVDGAPMSPGLFVAAESDVIVLRPNYVETDSMTEEEAAAGNRNSIIFWAGKVWAEGGGQPGPDTTWANRDESARLIQIANYWGRVGWETDSQRAHGYGLAFGPALNWVVPRRGGRHLGLVRGSRGVG